MNALKAARFLFSSVVVTALLWSFSAAAFTLLRNMSQQSTYYLIAALLLLGAIITAIVSVYWAMVKLASKAVLSSVSKPALLALSIIVLFIPLKLIWIYQFD